MKIQSSLRFARQAGVLLLAALILAIAGCSGEYGYSRSVFQGKVVDRAAADIESFASKPDNLDRLSGGDEVWTYNKRTFDAENGNSKDAAVKVPLRKDPKSGTMMYSEIDFVAQ